VDPKRIWRTRSRRFSLRGLAGYATDETTTNEAGTVTDKGPSLGIGAELIATSWATQPSSDRVLPPVRFFASTSFDFVNVNFAKLEGWSSSYRVRPAAGVIVAAPKNALAYLYGGASWEYLSRNQTTGVSVQGVPTPVRFRAEEVQPWSVVVGMIYQNVFGFVNVERFDLLAEGDVGGRSGAQVSLRYKFMY
jgi:hypothetical protein